MRRRHTPGRQHVADSFGKEASNNVIFDVYGKNAFKGLTRSHQNVTRKYYPEVLLPS